MLTLEQIVKRLEDRNLKAVASITGLGYATIANIANGTNQNPTYKIIFALSEYLEGSEE